MESIWGKNLRSNRTLHTKLAERSKNPPCRPPYPAAAGRGTRASSPLQPSKNKGVSPNLSNPTGAKARMERERYECYGSRVGLRNEIGVIPSTTVANLKRRKAATAARTAKRSRRSISWPRRGVATGDSLRFLGSTGAGRAALC